MQHNALTPHAILDVDVTGASLRSSLAWAKQQLSFLDDSEASREAECILEEVSGFPRAELYLRNSLELSQEQKARFQKMVQLRKERIPLAYVLGKAFFFNEELEVNRHVLIPRPETEIVVERFIEYSGCQRQDRFTFLDLGTGSGAIAVALLRHFPHSIATCLDISQEALEVASRNLARYGLSERAEILCSDLFQRCGSRAWDVILSNPPYVAQHEFSGLCPELLWEPPVALSGGLDGYDIYRKIALQAPGYLAVKGWLGLEVGSNQAKVVMAQLTQNGFLQVRSHRDDAGMERVVTARWRN